MLWDPRKMAFYNGHTLQTNEYAALQMHVL